MGQRLLLVDDEPSLLRAVAACLRAEGYEVLTARTGSDALVSLAQIIPDLVISDIRMPGMDGYTLARHIRASDRTALIPIIFLTAKDQRPDRIEGFRAGIDAYLTKPFEPDELLVVIVSILDRVERTHAAIARLVSPGEPAQVLLSDPDLTETEIRIAEAIACGLTNKEIATKFSVSVRTVENHVSHILAKKGFSNRVEIARYIFEAKPAE
jgi:DNA-binding NarL/FixJ family response regulator